jgi:hypothetical protein
MGSRGGQGATRPDLMNAFQDRADLFRRRRGVDNQSHCERLSRNRIADRPVRLARQTKLGSQSQISIVPGVFRFWLLLFPIDTPYTASPDAITQGGFVKRRFDLRNKWMAEPWMKAFLMNSNGLDGRSDPPDSGVSPPVGRTPIRASGNEFGFMADDEFDNVVS